jgi:flagellar FliJ protein
MSTKTLRTLVRLNEWEVDERRRRLGELMRLVESLEHQIDILKQELAREQQAASASPDLAGFLFGNYILTVIARRNWIEQSIAKAQEEVDAAREELREAFLQLKKFEQIKDRHADQEQAVIDRFERLQLDEVALQAYRLKNS